MTYRVHRFEIDMENDADRLETFLNGLDGEVVSIVPHVRRTTLTQIYGATRKIDFLFVVERTGPGATARPHVTSERPPTDPCTARPDRPEDLRAGGSAAA